MFWIRWLQPRSVPPIAPPTTHTRTLYPCLLSPLLPLFFLFSPEQSAMQNRVPKPLGHWRGKVNMHNRCASAHLMGPLCAVWLVLKNRPDIVAPWEETDSVSWAFSWFKGWDTLFCDILQSALLFQLPCWNGTLSPQLPSAIVSKHLWYMTHYAVYFR